MGVGFRLNLKCGFPLPNSHWQPNPPSTTPVRNSSGRLSFLSVISEECETSSSRDSLKVYTCPSASPQLLDDGLSELEEKMKSWRMPKSGSGCMIDHKDYRIMSTAGLRTSHFTLLMQNLNVLEETFADSSVSKLEREILFHLGRLGALKLFEICLSRTLKTSSFLDLSDVPTEPIKEHKMELKNIVRCGKKEEQRSIKRTSDGSGKYSGTLPVKDMRKGFKKPMASSGRRASNCRSRRLVIAKNETDMSVGVKVLADLERLKVTLEKETGRVTSLRCWAEAAGVDEGAATTIAVWLVLSR